jgi:hypothetical protein
MAEELLNGASLKFNLCLSSCLRRCKQELAIEGSEGSFETDKVGDEISEIKTKKMKQTEENRFFFCDDRRGEL